MKNTFFLLLLLFLFYSCTKKIEFSVFNNSETDRKNEMVEINIAELPAFDASKVVLLDAQRHQVPYQIIYKGGKKPLSFIFQVSLKAGEKATFTVQNGEPEKFTVKTRARFIPERKDDISWENDCIGFRMYGPALASENPSNGVDDWLKRTDKLVFDEWYKKDLSRKASYHEDHGEGLDCYNVGHTLGAGGICPYTKDSLWIGRYFDRYKILDDGPLRSTFVLFYDSIPFGSKYLQAELQLTLDASSNLNKATIRYTGNATRIQLAAGILLHDSIQRTMGSTSQKFLGYAENAVTQNKKKLSMGRSYVGVVFISEVVETKQQQGHLIGICNYRMGEPFTYYFGAAWSKYGFDEDHVWLDYLSAKQEALQKPLKVEFSIVKTKNS